MSKQTLIASDQPLLDIDKIKYPGQPMSLRMYAGGYEEHFNRMPVLTDNDPCLMKHIAESQDIMRNVALHVSHDDYLMTANVPEPGTFNRTILGLEAPRVLPSGELKEGKEIILAKWGDGFTSPVHGHLSGFMFEHLISGKLLITTYFMPNKYEPRVRIIQAEIFDKPLSDLVTAYEKEGGHFKRQNYIHSFRSIGISKSVHYVPEHTRDGRDNQFIVDHFDDYHEVTSQDYQRIDHSQALRSNVGDVILVSSADYPELGFHYIVVSGDPVVKSNGLRPQDIIIPAPNNKILHDYCQQPLVLLKLNEKAADIFRQFHNITVENNQLKLQTN